MEGIVHFIFMFLRNIQIVLTSESMISSQRISDSLNHDTYQMSSLYFFPKVSQMEEICFNDIYQTFLKSQLVDVDRLCLLVSLLLAIFKVCGDQSQWWSLKSTLMCGPTLIYHGWANSCQSCQLELKLPFLYLDRWVPHPSALSRSRAVSLYCY